MPCAPTGLTIRHQSARGHNRFFVMRGMRIRHGNRQAPRGGQKQKQSDEGETAGRPGAASEPPSHAENEGEETTAAAPERAQPFVMLTRPSYGL